MTNTIKLSVTHLSHQRALTEIIGNYMDCFRIGKSFSERSPHQDDDTGYITQNLHLGIALGLLPNQHSEAPSYPP